MTTADIEALKSTGVAGRVSHSCPPFDQSFSSYTYHRTSSQSKLKSMLLLNSRMSTANQNTLPAKSQSRSQSCPSELADARSRYIKVFTVLPSTEYYVCEADFICKNTGPTKIRDLRPDTLAQLMCHCNIHPGSRAIVVEDCSGILVGSALARMNGQGTLFQINDADSPPSNPLLPAFNLTKEEMKPFIAQNWAALEPDYQHADLPMAPENEGGKPKNERERTKFHKRRQLYEQTIADRENFAAGEWDAYV